MLIANIDQINTDYQIAFKTDQIKALFTNHSHQNLLKVLFSPTYQ